MDIPTAKAPAHELPSWPMNCLNFYCHLANDYGRLLQRLGGAVDPAQTARAEGDYGISLMHDMMQAWCDLALSPFAAMTKVATSAPASASVQPAQAPADQATAARSA